ncbi:hypothetical protein DYB26_009017 [Aphanomyces astaci]|uniref:Ataxin-2 C-terminal domain-containing protein n=1 Tax=Aphanomyces astaci TaxID=112090 RepID=A0A397CF93_APHAT|nr:hypothetical protein DYB36_007616 [Aphanomyces astaci]RHY42426.1 hypothetical protein DYB38_009582 [Aphanomyces astaci]RHZ01302.1 hypothetical protein DYB26_009017 [Aphanomyces astaci]RHZ10883.1 hypothetical protein DYB31_009295 [Aphanomyces astaci]
MKLNPKAASFVPTFGTWGAPPPPVPTDNKVYYDEYVEESYGPNAYPSQDYDDDGGDDEMNELLAEIERMQMEADLTRELESLKAQGRSDDADLWNKWMAGAPSPRAITYQDDHTPLYAQSGHHNHHQSNSSPRHHKKASPPYAQHTSRHHFADNSPRQSPRNSGAPQYQPSSQPRSSYTSRAIYQPRASNY